MGAPGSHKTVPVEMPTIVISASWPRTQPPRRISMSFQASRTSARWSEGRKLSPNRWRRERSVVQK